MRWRATIGALVLTAVAPASAEAYSVGGAKWPGRTITYHSDAPAFDSAVKLAVRAWNTSGANIRFKEVGRSRARLRIGYMSRLSSAGQATLGWTSPNVITFRMAGGISVSGNAPCGLRIRFPHRKRRFPIRCLRGPRVLLAKLGTRNPSDNLEPLTVRALIVAHELGHVLGLRHQQSRCSVMSYRRDENCAKPPSPFEVRCRLLEADDVAGAIARYGGRAKPLAPEFCPAHERPGAVSDLTTRFDASRRSLEVRWRNPASSAYRHSVVDGRFGACPKRPGNVVFGGSDNGDGTSSTTIYLGEESGRYCVTVWATDADNRADEPVSVTVDIPPRPAPEE